ncbi:hypothetical protein RND81_10G027400 [Saponaria officinalis]|uniref:Uncharacterized protein n=1 Tax=Saponaria officinalis TaxID=3572 RepID=A0AAW1HXM4_SAPOF
MQLHNHHLGLRSWHAIQPSLGKITLLSSGCLSLVPFYRYHLDVLDFAICCTTYFDITRNSNSQSSLISYTFRFSHYSLIYLFTLEMIVNGPFSKNRIRPELLSLPKSIANINPFSTSIIKVLLCCCCKLVLQYSNLFIVVVN